MKLCLLLSLILTFFASEVSFAQRGGGVGTQQGKDVVERATGRKERQQQREAGRSVARERRNSPLPLGPQGEIRLQLPTRIERLFRELSTQGQRLEGARNTQCRVLHTPADMAVGQRRVVKLQLEMKSLLELIDGSVSAENLDLIMQRVYAASRNADIFSYMERTTAQLREQAEALENHQGALLVRQEDGSFKEVQPNTQAGREAIRNLLWETVYLPQLQAVADANSGVTLQDIKEFRENCLLV